jgi:PASTA domain
MFQPRSLGLLLVVAAALVAPTTAFAAAPPNDAFAAAQELTGRVVSVEGLNKDATKEAGEPAHAGESGGASIWYRWTAPGDGNAVVATCNSDFDTVLAAYTGDSIATLAEVASNDDACGTKSRVSFPASAGVTYRIAIDGVHAATGAASLDLRLAPANDDFAASTAISGDTGSVDGTNLGASRETGEPDYLYTSVWYRWTAPSSAPATFETCGAAFDTILVVFTGDALDSMSYVTGSDDDCGLASRVHFDATAGVEYRIAVDGYSTGDFSLSWNRNPPPPLPPYAQDYPWIAGTPREGETLTASEGEWAGTAPVSFAYAWGRCNSDYERCDFIPGAVARTYVLAAADVGHHIYVRVTGTNVAGSSSEYSDPTALVRPSGPMNTAPPVVRGTAIVGETLNASDGSWSGPTPIQYTYQWQACDAAGAACVDLQGERLSFIELRSAHVGKRLRVVVTGTNVDGSRSVASEASAAVVQRKVTKKVACVVPNVRGKSLKAAKTRIRRAHCKTGRVTRAYSRSVARGRVIAQKPKAGARMKQGAPIKLVVSKGRRR